MDYRRDMLKLFTFLKPHASTHKIVWRESFAQHFASEGGEYQKGAERCVPVEYGKKHGHMWRDVIVREIVESEEIDLPIIFLNETAGRKQPEPGPGAIYWLPAADWTVKNWLGVHKTSKEGVCEATHVCHAGGVWGHFWELLERVVKKEA